jgi:hypothetical protein
MAILEQKKSIHQALLEHHSKQLLFSIYVKFFYKSGIKIVVSPLIHR